MSDMELRQRILDGDEQALNEVMVRLAQARQRADEEQKRADELRSRVTQLKYVYNLTNRCTLDYLRLRPAYLTC